MVGDDDDAVGRTTADIQVNSTGIIIIIIIKLYADKS